MIIKDLTDLDKLISLCRKRGIKAVKVGDLELTLGEPEPKVKRKPRKAAAATQEAEDIESDGPTSDDMLFWSSSALAHDAQ